jgi:hypothetical protein
MFEAISALVAPVTEVKDNGGGEVEVLDGA